MANKSARPRGRERARLDAERVGDATCDHGEGPIWDEVERRLVFVDMLKGDVVSYRPGDDSRGFQRTHVSSVAAALRPRVAGGFILATERGFGLLSSDFKHLEDLGDVFDDPSLRMNDGGCDQFGSFYCGTMAYDETPGAGTLFRLSPDRDVEVTESDVTISNGLCLGPDHHVAYYVDTPTHRIDTFEIDTTLRTLTNRRPWVDIPASEGSPDGLTVDAAGGVWVALWEGSAVHRYDPDGALDVVVTVPTRCVTSCAFGGADLDDLYITTSASGSTGDADSFAGALYRVSPGFQGLTPLPYAG
jgi:sugar lactone lactonase YvrE